MKVKNDHRSKFSNLSNWKDEASKNQGFNGIRTRDLNYFVRKPDVLAWSTCVFSSIYIVPGIYTETSSFALFYSLPCMT